MDSALFTPRFFLFQNKSIILMVSTCIGLQLFLLITCYILVCVCVCVCPCVFCGVCVCVYVCSVVCVCVSMCALKAKSRTIAIPVDLDCQVNNLFVKSNNIVQKTALSWRQSARNAARKDSVLATSRDYRNII